jgi:thiamine biosynthesis lipoprotein
VHIRCPGEDGRIVRAGLLRNAAIATSGALTTIGRSDRDEGTLAPHADRCAYSVVAPTCLIADALTKVLIQRRDPGASCFKAFCATAFITPPDAAEDKAA